MFCGICGRQVLFIVKISLVCSGHCQDTQVLEAFFRGIHGLILVHNTCNSKSHANLDRWLNQYLAYSRKFHNDTLGNRRVPLLVGTLDSSRDLDDDHIQSGLF